MKPKNVLVVEDELLIGKDLENSLLLDGYQSVKLVNTGENALDIVKKKNGPDIILMDISLSDKKYYGIATAREIKEKYDIPVVFMTGHSDIETRKNAEKASPYGYLTKPVSKEELSIALETAYSRHIEENQLKKAEEKYRTIAEESTLSFFILQNQQIVFANESFMSLTGYSNSEIYNANGKKFYQLFPENDGNKELLIHDLLSVENLEKLSLSCPLKPKNKAIKWVELYSKIIKFNNHPARLVTLIDITDRKKLESKTCRQIDKASRKQIATDNMISLASRELKNPLLNILGFSDELNNYINQLKTIINPLGNSEKYDKLINKDISEAIGFITSNAEELETLISGLLKILRIQKMSLVKTTIDPKKIIDDLIEKQNTNDITIEYKNSLHSVYADKKLLKIGIESIIDNAIKFSDQEKNSFLKISSVKSEDYIALSFQDNGIGMHPNLKFKAFDLFTHGHLNTSGRGIGLAVLKEILEAHNGYAEINSQKGIETTITIYLKNSMDS